MRNEFQIGLGLICLTAAFPAFASPIPDNVAAIIKAAADTGDAATLRR